MKDTAFENGLGLEVKKERRLKAKQCGWKCDKINRRGAPRSGKFGK